ncbi:MAG: KH domain-containing protein [Candidatus Micrarchaeaceae archaeon]
MREVLFPGDVVTDRPVRMQNTTISDGVTIATNLGMREDGKERIVPLTGPWVPRIGDQVVGVVEATKGNMSIVDLSFFGKGIILYGKDSRSEKFAPGDAVEATVKNVENRKDVILAFPTPLPGGIIINVKPTKVPRVIGKSNTMVNQISKLTRCKIVVGRNGMVWIDGGNVALAIAALQKVELEAHTHGLTDRIREMLEKGIVD